MMNRDDRAWATRQTLRNLLKPCLIGNKHRIEAGGFQGGGACNASALKASGGHRARALPPHCLSAESDCRSQAQPRTDAAPRGLSSRCQGWSRAAESGVRLSSPTGPLSVISTGRGLAAARRSTISASSAPSASVKRPLAPPSDPFCKRSQIFEFLVIPHALKPGGWPIPKQPMDIKRPASFRPGSRKALAAKELANADHRADHVPVYVAIVSDAGAVHDEVDGFVDAGVDRPASARSRCR